MPYPSTSIYTCSTFITSFINKNSIVSTTKLDSTIKGIITFLNIEKKKESKNTRNSNTRASILIGYLNKLRIIYFLKRLKYLDSKEALKLNSKFYNPFFY